MAQMSISRAVFQPEADLGQNLFVVLQLTLENAWNIESIHTTEAGAIETKHKIAEDRGYELDEMKLWLRIDTYRLEK